MSATSSKPCSPRGTRRKGPLRSITLPGSGPHRCARSPRSWWPRRVARIPIALRQMRVLRREGVTWVSVLAGHLGDRLRPALEPEAAALGLALQVIVEPSPLGTAGCLTALDRGAEEVLIVYGDMLF